MSAKASTVAGAVARVVARAVVGAVAGAVAGAAAQAGAERRGRRTDAGDAGSPRRGTYASRQGTGPRLPLCAVRWCSMTRAGRVSATRSSALLPPSSPSLPPPSLTRVFVPAFHASG